MDLGWWDGRTCACPSLWCVMSGEGVTGEGSKEETSNPAGGRRMLLSCPLAPPESSGKSLLAWQLPKPGPKGGRVLGPAPGRGGQPRGSSAPAPLRTSRAPQEWGRPGLGAGEPRLGQVEGVWDFPTSAVPEASPALPPSLPVTPGLPATPPPPSSRLVAPWHWTWGAGRVGECVAGCVRQGPVTCIQALEHLGCLSCFWLPSNPPCSTSALPPPSPRDPDRKRGPCQGWGCVTEAAAPGGGEGRVGRGRISSELGWQLVASRSWSWQSPARVAPGLLNARLVGFTVAESSPAVVQELKVTSKVVAAAARRVGVGRSLGPKL